MRHEDLEQVERMHRDDIDSVRAEVGEQLRQTKAQVSDLETDVDAVKRALEELEDWQEAVETRWRETIQPWIDYWYDHGDALQSLLAW